MSRLATLALAALLVAGCYSADYKLTLRNDTAESWLVRVEPGGSFGEGYSVRRIEPAGEGIVADWSGVPDVQIELLSG